MFEVENFDNNLISVQTGLTEVTVENLIFTNSQRQVQWPLENIRL